MKDLHGTTRHPAKMFHVLYEADADEDEVPRQVPTFCISLPRVLMTPLRVNVTGFETEMSNRLVRKFVEEIGFPSEAFIRVSIGDENGDKMFSDDLSNHVEKRIKSLLLNGIVFGKKKYIFLAYSSSQLKEHSMWMICPERGWSIAKIRDSMGDFSMCKVSEWQYIISVASLVFVMTDLFFHRLLPSLLPEWASASAPLLIHPLERFKVIEA